MLDIPTTAKNPVLERLKRGGMDESKRTALRLKPDVSKLHRTILSWSYDFSGPQPPGQPLRLQRVPERFEQMRHFIDVFEPLLLMECWAQLQQSKEENADAYGCNIVGRQYTDDWVDVEVSMADGVDKDWYLLETDIVLLRHPTNGSCNLMKVQHFQRSGLGLQATLRMVANPSDPGPQGGTVWRLSKVFR